MEAQLAASFPVRVETRAGRGRCLVAARDLAAGETVLACAPAAVLPFLGAGACCHCAARPAAGKALARCSACKRAAYCDRHCQAAAWADHKVECAAWGNVATLPDIGGAVTHAVLAGRVFRGARLRKAAAAAADATTGEAAAASAARGAAVYTHTLADVLAMERDDSPLRAGADAIAVEIARSNKLLPDDVTDADVRRVVAAFERNNFSVADELLVSRAAGVYPAGALLNHACAPNCVIGFEDYWLPDGAGEAAYADAARGARRGCALQVVRTLVAVPSGAELLHSYVEIARPREERQRALFQSYGFRCSCALCELPPSDPRCPESFLETRLVAAEGGGGGARLPLPLALAPAGGAPDPTGGAGHIPGGVPADAATAIKSARVLLQAVEAGPPPPPASAAAGDGAGGPPPKPRLLQPPQPVHLTEELLARVAASNAPLLLAGVADVGDGQLLRLAPPPDAPTARCVVVRAAGGGGEDGGSGGGGGGGPSSERLLWRYEPTRGSVTALDDADAAGARLELTALEAALALLAGGGMHPLGLDVFAATQMGWSRYLLLEDLPLAAVAGESMRGFYDAVYALAPQHPMRGLHLFSLGDTYRTLLETVGPYASLKARKQQQQGGGSGGAGAGGVVLVPPARAAALLALHRTPAARAALELLTRPLSPTVADALRDRALGCYDDCARSLGLWMGAAHPMPAKARALAAELRAQAAEGGA